MLVIPYREICVNTLQNWYGKSPEVARELAYVRTLNELEDGIDVLDEAGNFTKVEGAYAKNSVKSAATSLVSQLGLASLAEQFGSAIMEGRGPATDEIFKVVGEVARNVSEQNVYVMILNILGATHNNWVVNNSSQKIFNKKVNDKKLRQYAPLELIGWNEAMNDMVFVKPILDSVGISFDMTKLESVYHAFVAQYMESLELTSRESLVELVAQGSNYYLALPEGLAQNLVPYADEMANQIIDNWAKKDKFSAMLFQKMGEKGYQTEKNKGLK